MAKQRNKALAVDEYEILDNGVIIMREETRKYFVVAGVTKQGRTRTFNGQHYYYEETIALARRYGDEVFPDEAICNDSECCPNTSLEDAVSGFYPKGEAVEAKRKDREEVRLGISWEGSTN